MKGENPNRKTFNESFQNLWVAKMENIDGGFYVKNFI